MGKTPSFQFYPSDWTRDLGDQPHEIGGAWMLILCSLFWQGGKQTKTLDEWAKVLRESRKKTEKILNYLNEKQIADFECLDNQNITIISRRMVKDFQISQLRQEVGKLGGNPKLIKKSGNLDNQTDNQNPTPSSSSSKKEKVEKKNILTDEEWLKTLEDNPIYQGLEVRVLYGKMLVWCDTRGKKPTRRRFVNWLNREERPLNSGNGKSKGSW